MKTLTVNGLMFIHDRCLNRYDIYYCGPIQLAHNLETNLFEVRSHEEQGHWRRTPERALQDFRRVPIGVAPTKGAEPCEQPGESPGDSSPPGELTIKIVDPNDIPRLSEVELAALTALVNAEHRMQVLDDDGLEVWISKQSQAAIRQCSAIDALRDELRRRGVIGGGR